MSVTIRIRRGTKAELNSITLAAGELGLTTDEKRVYVGDGSQNLMIGRVEYGTLATRPSAGVAGRLYVVTDANDQAIFLDDGTSWVRCGVSHLGDLSGTLDDIADGVQYRRVAASEVDSSGHVTQISSGANTVTAAQARTHIDDVTIHRSINDSVISTTSLWSSSKIDESIAAAIHGLDWQESVLDKDLTTPPSSPNLKDRYIVGTGATGAWSTHDQQIAEWNGSAWIFIPPNEGFCCRVEDEDIDYVYNGTTWVSKASGTNHNSLAGLQGGDVGEYYHLTSAQHSALTSGLSESVQDIVGGMFLGNSEVGITATYQDTSGTIDLVLSFETAEPPGVGPGAGTAGTATTVARGDHSHDLGVHNHSDSNSGGTISHSVLTGIGPNDHHDEVHDLVSSKHTATGLTAGHVLRASGATTFGFSALQATDLPAHASRHKHGGDDPIGSVTPAAFTILMSDGSGKINDQWLPVLDGGTFV